MTRFTPKGSTTAGSEHRTDWISSTEETQDQLVAWRCLDWPYHRQTGHSITRPSSRYGYILKVLVPLGASNRPMLA